MVNVKNPDGITALCIASAAGHNEVVRLLLENGANVNVKATEMHFTPLWSASSEGHTEIVKLLLDNGADIEIRANNITPLEIAKSGGHKQIVELLEKAADQKLEAKTDATSNQIESNVNLVDYYCQNGKYTIGLPVDWVKEEQEFSQGLRMLSALSPNESSSDPFTENINVIVVPEETKDLNIALEKSIRLGHENMPRFQLLDKGFSSMGENKVAWHIHSHDYEGKPINALKALMINQNKTCLVTCTALPDTFDTYRPVFNQIISSIRFDKLKAETSVPNRRTAPTGTPPTDTVGIAGKLGALIGGLVGMICFISLFMKKKKFKGKPQAHTNCTTIAKSESTTRSMPSEKTQFYDCPDCGAGGIITDEDGNCTHCGYTLEDKQKESNTNADSKKSFQDSTPQESSLSSNEYSKAPQLIKPSITQITIGIGLIVSALCVALGSIATLLPKIPLNNRPDGNLILAEHLGVLIGCCLAAWVGFGKFKTIDVDKLIKELDSSDNSKRQKAADTLMEQKWEPTDMTQKVKLLVARKMYKEAVALDPMAVERMIDTLKITNVSVEKEILKSFVKLDCQTAVPLLIELMAEKNTAVSKQQIVKTLKKLTGQKIAPDHNQWRREKGSGLNGTSISRKAL